MTTRRHFIVIAPLAGTALLAACSDKAPPPAPAPTPAPRPAPAAAPAPAAEAAPAAAPATTPANTAVVAENDPTAVALGYVTDASRVDAARFKTYVSGQACSNCSLFAGKAGDAMGPCPIFSGRQVAAKGWCSSYVKKPA